MWGLVQAEALLGVSADEVAPLKQASDAAAYEEVLKRAQWSEWVLRVQSRTQCVTPSRLLDQ